MGTIGGYLRRVDEDWEWSLGRKPRCASRVPYRRWYGEPFGDFDIDIATNEFGNIMRWGKLGARADQQALFVGYPGRYFWAIETGVS